MQKLMGYMRRAIEDYHMIGEGDRIAVGVSGGKDSMALLAGLCEMRRYFPRHFSLVAITLDPGFGGAWQDYGPVEAFCRQQGVPYLVRRTEIGAIVFEQRQEKNPCSLCARMRRGALHDAALAQQCNKVALGHHADDAVETFLMNLFNEGRVGCFSPVSYLSRKQLTMIRPLALMPEQEVARAAARLGLPVVKSACPMDGHTRRQWTKALLQSLEEGDPGLKARIFGAIRRGHISQW